MQHTVCTAMSHKTSTSQAACKDTRVSFYGSWLILLNIFNYLNKEATSQVNVCLDRLIAAGYGPPSNPLFVHSLINQNKHDWSP